MLITSKDLSVGTPNVDVVPIGHPGFCFDDIANIPVTVVKLRQGQSLKLRAIAVKVRSAVPTPQRLRTGFRARPGNRERPQQVEPRLRRLLHKPAGDRLQRVRLGRMVPAAQDRAVQGAGRLLPGRAESFLPRPACQEGRPPQPHPPDAIDCRRWF